MYYNDDPQNRLVNSAVKSNTKTQLVKSTWKFIPT